MDEVESRFDELYDSKLWQEVILLLEKQHQSQLQIGFERTYQPREQTQRIVCVDGNDHEEENIGSEEEGYEDKNDEQQETAGDDGAMEKGQEEKLQVRRHWPRRRTVDVPARRGCEAKVLGGGFSQCAVLLDGVAAAKFAVLISTILWWFVIWGHGRGEAAGKMAGTASMQQRVDPFPSYAKDPAAPARLITHPPSLPRLPASPFRRSRYQRSCPVGFQCRSQVGGKFPVI
ncbi:hypothetical protein B296_00004354 [Ensete ventricosum]|uniref:Uncharacterized protein n=1 Tax=Ensete ventricosum TaxID=4639 RepID=A0A426YM86_ENSVE|nr:hypothetical protein B296_00004354 [Ensete ventricosum]